ncbi:MAG: hypothetical protein U0X91_03260 [Spirosomataceae bacterium]
MDWREKTILNVFGGNEQKFDKAFNEAAREAIAEAVSWKDIALSTTVLPNLEGAAQELIEQHLGYLPHPAVLLPYEPYLRALLAQKNQGQLSAEAFVGETQMHCQLIRNVDMAHYADPEPAHQFQSMYADFFHLYGIRAKARLSRFLGYEPAIEHSLMAELWLWEIMARDTVRLPDNPTAVDYKALTIIRYREVLLSQGRAAADALPLKPFS